MPDFGEWLPDLIELGNPGTAIATNVTPSLDGFRAAMALAPSSSALDAACRGAYATVSNTGDAYNYAGDGGKLYQLEAGQWQDQSKSGGYTVGAEEGWQFEKWGELVIAVGGVSATNPVPIQYITMGPVVSTQFEDLPGNPPQARAIAVVREFVVLGNLFDGGVLLPSRVRWPGISEPTFWGVDAAKQADYQDLKGGGGAIQGIAGGEYGVIIQEQSIRRMDYTGAKTIFAIDETLPGVGTPAPRSIVQYGDVIFFLGRSGFEAVTQGATREKIGANKIDRTFYDLLDRSYIKNVIGALDRINEQVRWIFPGPGSSMGLPNSSVIFDLKSARWGPVTIDCEHIYDGRSPGYTLEELDALYPTLEDVPGSLDSAQWAGGASQLYGFNAEHKSGAFEGDVLQATIETRESHIFQGRGVVNKVRPEVELVSSEAKTSSGGAITVQAGYRDNIGDPVLWTSESGIARDGNGAVRSKGYYHRLRATISAEFRRARGIAVVTGRNTKR